MHDADESQDLIRELLVRELETVNVYTEMLESARTPEVRALLAEITAQEKHHIAEAADLLARYDAGQAAAFARAGVAVRREPEPEPAPAPATVVYEPSGAVAAVGPAETLLAAGLGAGVDIRHDCGGKGICGTCRVEVLEGGAAMSEVTAPERKHLAELVGAGWRLSCQTRPGGDARLRVPPNERTKKKEDDTA
jgi:ferredoxin